MINGQSISYANMILISQCRGLTMLADSKQLHEGPKIGAIQTKLVKQKIGVKLNIMPTFNLYRNKW